MSNSNRILLMHNG